MILKFLMMSLLALCDVTFAMFPNGRCFIHTCDASPYTLPIVQQTDNSVCFQIQHQDCTSVSNYDCCNIFHNYVNKIIISSSPTCSYKSISNITLDGFLKIGGIYFDYYNNNTEAELRITNLNFSGYNNILNHTLCINFQNECPSFTSFSRPHYKFALFNTDAHTCCPTCHLQVPRISQMPVIPVIPVIPDIPVNYKHDFFLNFSIHCYGAYTTVKGIEIRQSIKDIINQSYSFIQFGKRDANPSFSFTVYFTIGPYETKEQANRDYYLLQNIHATANNGKPIIIKNISSNIFSNTSPSIITSPLTPMQPRISPPMQPIISSPLSPLPPMQPIIDNPIPISSHSSPCSQPYCPNPLWPSSYCNLYIGVPIYCPCLCQNK